MLVERLKMWFLSLGAKDYEVEYLLSQCEVKKLEKKVVDQAESIEELQGKLDAALEIIEARNWA